MAFGMRVLVSTSITFIVLLHDICHRLTNYVCRRHAVNSFLSHTMAFTFHDPEENPYPHHGRSRLGGGGVQNKNPPWGSMDIFWNYTWGSMDIFWNYTLDN